jgi:Kef-type K+ transport system membrane component KefB
MDAELGHSLHALVLVPLIAAAAPLLTDALSRWIRIPIVVFEIVLGIAFGPDVAGWIKPDAFISTLAELGLAMLFLLAGYEIDFGRIRGRPLRRSVAGWLLSLALGVGLGVLLAPNATAGVFVGIALCSTALGTIMPVLRDARELQTVFGTAVLAIGAVGEFGPLIAIALFLSGRSPGKASVILIAFALVVAAAIVLTTRRAHPRVHRLIEATLHSSGQFAVRLVVLLLASLVALATALGLDMLLGAFSAGVLLNLLMADSDPNAKHYVDSKLDAVGFGFLIPVFFINTGVTFDLDALLRKASTLALVPVVLVLFVLVRGLPATLAAPPTASIRDRVAIAFFGATGLPIIVAVTAIGVDAGALTSSTAAALVGAGMLSVLVFPMLALRQRHARPAIAPESQP